MLAQAFDVFDQVPRGVVHQVRVRTALAAAALIEQDDAIALRVKEATHASIGATTGPAVEKYRWFSARVARFLVIQLVDLGHAQIPAPVRFDGRIEFAGFGASGRLARGSGFGGRHFDVGRSGWTALGCGGGRAVSTGTSRSFRR